MDIPVLDGEISTVVDGFTVRETPWFKMGKDQRKILVVQYCTDAHNAGVCKRTIEAETESAEDAAMARQQLVTDLKAAHPLGVTPYAD